MNYQEIIKFGTEIYCLDINSRGSGFILRKDGLIGTNWHVVHSNEGVCSKTIVVRDQDNNKYPAKILKTDREKDFAVLKIDNVFDKEPMLGEFDSVVAFDEVYFVGRGLDIPNISLHKGWISMKTQKDGLEILQIDGPINQGNSGGPVFNKKGKIIAIITQTEARFDMDLQSLLQLIPQLQGDITIFGIRLPETLRRIIFYLNRNRFVGVGYAFSIEYIKRALKDLEP